MLATIFQYGSGNYSNVNSGFNLLGGPGANRFRRDGTFIPVNTFLGDPAQSLDFRVSKEFRIGSRLRVTGMAEVFNIYNYKRYSYNLVETNAAYGQPNASAGPPRTGQLAFRVAF